MKSIELPYPCQRAHVWISSLVYHNSLASQKSMQQRLANLKSSPWPHLITDVVFHYSWFSRLQQCGWNGAILRVTFWLETHCRYQEHQACVQEFTKINYVECQIKHCSFFHALHQWSKQINLVHGYASRQEYSYINKWALAPCSRLCRIPSVNDSS